MLRSPGLIRVTLSLVSPGILCPSLGVQPLLLRSHAQIWTKRTSPAPVQHRSVIPCSDLASQRYTLIYAFPAIQGLRALSRLKLVQTGITGIFVPIVYYSYLQGQASFSVLGYTTGIAAFAAIMLYTISHYIRRVVGMMYLDPTHTTLKVAHLSFWGHRRHVYLPVSDVLTLGDAGDSPSELILKLKRYSCSDTFYFSVRLGRLIDKKGFEKVFGILSG